MRGIYFSILVIGLVVYLLWIQGKEFRRRAKEIRQMYKDLEKYLIRGSKWSKVQTYPSNYYVIKFQTSEEIIDQMAIMISEAIKCFKQQNVWEKLITEDLLFDLRTINQKLIIIYTF